MATPYMKRTSCTFLAGSSFLRVCLIEHIRGNSLSKRKAQKAMTKEPALANIEFVATANIPHNILDA